MEYKKRTTLFVFPEYGLVGPRTIRLKNIVKNLRFDPNFNYLIACYKYPTLKKGNYLFFPTSNIYHFLKQSKIFSVIGKFFPSKLFPDLNIFFLQRHLKFIVNAYKEYKISQVVFVVNPNSNLMLSIELKNRLPDCRIIIDIGDPFYGNANNVHVSREQDKFKIESEALKIANKIIVTNEGTKLFYKNTYHIEEKNVVVIPQGVDIDLIQKVKRKYPYTQGKDRKKIVYSGIFYKDLRDPTPFFEFLENTDKFYLEVYGAGKRNNIQNAAFFNRKEQSKLFVDMNTADCLLFIDNAEGIQTSGKIYELLAFNKPIIFLYTNSNSETFSFIKNNPNVIKIKNNFNHIKKTLKNVKFPVRIDNSNFYNKHSWESRSKLYKKVIQFKGFAN